MSRPSSRSRTQPSGAKMLTTFTVGILVGVCLVLPAIPSTVDLLYAGSVSFGTVGKAVITMMLLLVLVVVGFVTVFQIFVLTDW